MFNTMTRNNKNDLLKDSMILHVVVTCQEDMISTSNDIAGYRRQILKITFYDKTRQHCEKMQE